MRKPILGRSIRGGVASASAVAIMGTFAGLAGAGISDHTGSSSQYQYGKPPSVTALEPRSGARKGGTYVEIRGRHLFDATAVYFGSRPAKEFRSASETSIIAVSPPGKLGTVDVTVAAPAGLSKRTPADRFRYTKPKR